MWSFQKHCPFLWFDHWAEPITPLRTRPVNVICSCLNKKKIFLEPKSMLANTVGATFGQPAICLLSSFWSKSIIQKITNDRFAHSTVHLKKPPSCALIALHIYKSLQPVLIPYILCTYIFLTISALTNKRSVKCGAMASGTNREKSQFAK